MKIELLLPVLLMIAGKAFAGWEQLPPLPSPNGGFACGVVDRKIFVVGGTNWKEGTKHWLDVIWFFDLASHKWELHGRLPHPLAYAVTAEWNDELVIAGGTDGNQPCKEVWSIKPELELKRIGDLRADAVVAVGGIIGKNLLLLGGCADASKLTGFHNRAVRLNLDRGTISALQPPGDVAFGLAASVVVGREWFIFGGARHDPSIEVANLSAAWALDSDKDTWRGLQPYPIAVRGASAVKLDNYRILIAGGYGGQPEGFTAAAYIYDTERDAYTKTMDLPIAALVGLIRTGDSVYSLGGEDKGGHRTDACFRVKVAELLKAANATRSAD